MKLIQSIKALFQRPVSASLPADSIASAKQRTDNDNLAASLLAKVLHDEGIPFNQAEHVLTLPSGISLHTHFINLVPFSPEQLRVSTSIRAFHPIFFPQGLIEYQHASGTDLEHALITGFKSWSQMDLLTLQDAVSEKPQYCTITDMSFPAASPDAAPIRRQVILGPVGHLVTQPDYGSASDHPFCPCCLLTNSLPAFLELLAAPDFIGIRLFAARHADGSVVADCRVNGEDFAAGAEQLTNYARSWPDRGLEFRKQYVVVRTAIDTNEKSG